MFTLNQIWKKTTPCNKQWKTYANMDKNNQKWKFALECGKK